MEHQKFFGIKLVRVLLFHECSRARKLTEIYGSEKLFVGRSLKFYFVSVK